jgi:hypothetical protein
MNQASARSTPKWVVPAFRAVVVLFVFGAVVFCMMAAPISIRAMQTGQQPSLGAVLDDGPMFTPLRRVASLDPHGPLAIAGVQAGELVHIPDRWPRLSGIGETTRVEVTGADGATREVDIVLGAEPVDVSRAIMWLGFPCASLLSALALILAWRRADHFAERALAVGLSLYLMFDLGDALPTTLARTFAIAHWGVGAGGAYVCFALFAVYYLRPATSPLRLAERVTLAVLPVLALADTLALIPVRYGWSVPEWVRFFPVIYTQSVYVFLWIVMRGRWRESSGEARERLRWIGFAFAALWVSDLFGWYPENTVLLNLATLFTAIGPGLVFGYATLRRRVFDFGFAVNRAAVFGVTSLLLVGLFAALTAIADRVLHIGDGVARNWSDIAITVGLAIGAARIRKFAESWVERLVFRDLRAREEALRAFVRRSSHFETGPALLTALHDALAQFIGRNAVSVYRRAGADGYVAQIDDLGFGASIAVDAPIAVELRSRSAPLRDGSGWVLPMQQGGRIDGLVVVGEKADRETYRPDEVELLANCVRQVGLDLQALRVTSLEQELARRRMPDAPGTQVAV